MYFYVAVLLRELAEPTLWNDKNLNDILHESTFFPCAFQVSCYASIGRVYIQVYVDIREMLVVKPTDTVFTRAQRGCNCFEEIIGHFSFCLLFFFFFFFLIYGKALSSGSELI